MREFDNSLTTPSKLFSTSKILSFFIDVSKRGRAHHFFPGFLIMFFVMLYIYHYLHKNKTLILSILLSFVFIMSFLAIRKSVFILDIMFFVFLCFLLFIIIKIWKKINKWEKLIILFFSFFILLMVKIPTIGLENNFSLYKLFHIMLPLKGLRSISRIFMLIFPFLIIFASIGAEKLFIKKFKLTPIKKYVIFILIFSFLVFENLNNPIKPYTTLIESQELKSVDNDKFIYSKLPSKKNKIMLEIPYYLGRFIGRKSKDQNSSYMLKRRFHQNFILNGSVSVRRYKYNKKISDIIGFNQKKFSDKKSLKKLIQNYSVNYIIIRWARLQKYFKKKQELLKEIVLTKIKKSKKYAKIIFDDKTSTILEIQEYFPVSKIVRTFSLSHLRNHFIKVVLKKNYKGNISVSLNSKMIKTITSNNKKIYNLLFHKEKLLTSGNKIELLFENKVEIHTIGISKEI